MLYNQLRSFHAVAREGSAVKAARVLNITQPTVTTQVKELESHFGVELFHRRKGRLELSKLGKRLLLRTQIFFDAEMNIHELLISVGELTEGHLRVGASGPFHTMRILKEFRDRYPGIVVSVELGNTAQVLSSVHDLKTDVAVVSEITCGPKLRAVTMHRQQVVALVHASHALAAKDTLRLSDLDGEDMVMREEVSITRQTFEKSLEGAAVVPNIALEVGSREAVWEAVAEGHGIGIVSELSIRSDERVCPKAFEDCDIFTETHVICLKEREESLFIKAFLDMVKSCGASLFDAPSHIGK